MKAAVIVCFLAVVALTTAASGGLYTDRYDNLNIDEILANRRILVSYVKCLLEINNCTPEGKELKSHIREALENNCGKCSAVQRSRTRQVIGHLINNEPEFWDQLCQKYDPTKKYTVKYENELRTIAS